MNGAFNGSNIVQYGTAAERAALDTALIKPLSEWYETDTGKYYKWVGSWVSWIQDKNSPSRSLPFTLNSGQSRNILIKEGDIISISGNNSNAIIKKIDLLENVLQTWNFYNGTKIIGPFVGDQNFIISCISGSINVIVLNSDILISQITAVNTAVRGPIVFLGDSLTRGAQPNRAPGLWDGRTWWNTSTVNLASLGAGSWIVDVQVEGTANSASSSTIQTDGAGRLRWSYNGETAGIYVDVSQGGWYLLPSGGPTNVSCFVSVRGATAPPAAASATVTVSGNVNVSTWSLYGYAAFIGAGLGQEFIDYYCYGISGCKTADVVKFAPQALLSNPDVVVVLCGVNDGPASVSEAQASISNLKNIIDQACASTAKKVYVGDIFPNTYQTAATLKYEALVSSSIRAYCRSKQKCVFWSAYDKMVGNSASVTLRTGVFNTDNLHLIPFGSYTAASVLLAKIKQDFSIDRLRNNLADTWDSTLQVGAWNANPALRGTAGTGSGSNGVTGTVPDSYAASRSGATQSFVGGFAAASDGGMDWYTMAVSGAASGDYHAITQSVNVPSGVNVGDYFRIVAEFCILNTLTTGIEIFQIQASANSALQADYLVQLGANGRRIQNFTSEQPVLTLSSEPQKLLSGVTSFSLAIRIGAAATGGGSGTIGIRCLRIEKYQ